MDTLNFKHLFDHVSDAVYIVDEDRKIIYFNEIAERISGFTREEIVGSYCYDNLLNHIDETGKQLCFQGCPLKHSIDNNVVNTGAVYLHHKDGHRVKVNVKTIPYNDQLKYGVEIFNDASDLKTVKTLQDALSEQEMLNKIDALTQLPNRRYLDALLNGTILLGVNKKYAILFMDIDNFKQFNDQHGHEIGDQVLKMVSQTIQSNIRNSDIVVRYGGEEIIVILDYVTKKDALRIAEKLRMLVQSSTFRKTKGNLFVTISIGVKLFQSQNDLSQSIKAADKAMLEAKKRGKNQTVMFD
jgi:two-component system, cell cycle response regulator